MTSPDSFVAASRGPAVAGTIGIAARDTTRSRDLTEQINEVIESRHTDSRLDVNAIARALHVSRRQLYRYASGGGVAAMLDGRRVIAACDLLVSRPHLTIGEVAELSGFGMRSRMRAHFSLHVGESPAQYRRKALGQIARFARTIDADRADDSPGP